MTVRIDTNSKGIEDAKAAFVRARGEFQDLESQFLSVVDDLLCGADGRIRNLALLEACALSC